MQEIRLTPTSYIVLGLLEFAGESTPYGLKQLVARSVGNFWTLHHAQLYTEPERLAEGRLRDREARGSGRRRKLYAITAEGRAALDEWRSEPDDRAGRAARARPPEALLRRRSRGASPTAQLPAHRAKLAEYEAIRDGMPADVPRVRGWRSTRASATSAQFIELLGGARGLGFAAMSTAAEPRPAELPLPGGREGAKVRLHPLLTATIQGPPAWFLREEGRLAWRKAFGLGVPKDQWSGRRSCFLVEHPRAGPILIDTGFHASVAVSPRSNLGRRSGRSSTATST